MSKFYKALSDNRIKPNPGECTDILYRFLTDNALKVILGSLSAGKRYHFYCEGLKTFRI